MAVSKVTMKLLIDTKRKRVMFAEAGKECIDFLFHILALPIGSVIRLLTTKGMVGCLGNLYESLDNLDDTYIQSNQDKDTLLKPKSAAYATSGPLLLHTSSPVNKQFYKCFQHLYMSDNPGTCCPSCNRTMNKILDYVTPTVDNEVASNGGLVKGVVTYMVLDDLSVKPMSTISSITLLNEFCVKDVGVLKEKVVTLGMDEVFTLAPFLCFEDAEDFAAVQECLDQGLHGQHK
ncbi:uncharacterized protein LOC132053982 [Lycium ferocissimum]|uniref:uncharacterized protein LOC132053982 n=1 Tax=Lycium ferocissimum TaxID=112874 RepID=UPI002815017B|nr:uncharacterized protein LOC132053982 [Lycium ferocissimum]